MKDKARLAARRLEKLNSTEWATKKTEDREKKREYMRGYRELHPEKFCHRGKNNRDKQVAREYVHWAEKFGLLKRTGVCTTPMAEGKVCFGVTEWHHHKGYSGACRLDVVEICKRHHRLADNRRRASVNIKD